jgi:hypothetical protein
MLACSNTRGYELLAAGEIASFKDGRSRKVLVSSIRDYIEQRLAASAKSPPPRRRGRPRKAVQAGTAA